MSAYVVRVALNCFTKLRTPCKPRPQWGRVGTKFGLFYAEALTIFRFDMRVRSTIFLRLNNPSELRSDLAAVIGDPECFRSLDVAANPSSGNRDLTLPSQGTLPESLPESHCPMSQASLGLPRFAALWVCLIVKLRWRSDTRAAAAPFRPCMVPFLRIGFVEADPK